MCYNKYDSCTKWYKNITVSLNSILLQYDLSFNKLHNKQYDCHD